MEELVNKFRYVKAVMFYRLWPAIAKIDVGMRKYIWAYEKNYYSMCCREKIAKKNTGEQIDW